MALILINRLCVYNAYTDKRRDGPYERLNTAKSQITQIVKTPTFKAAPGQVALPDFRNLGVILRVTLLAEALRLVAAYAETPDLATAFSQFSSQGLLYEPVLLISLVALYVLAPWLRHLAYDAGVVVILVLVLVIVLALQLGLAALLPWRAPDSLLRSALLAVVVAGTTLTYLNWVQLRLMPSSAESRLMALQARIRPHFLFNALNSVLGLIREDPKRAEAMLENLADLFRGLMSEPRVLIPFREELALTRAYTDIEAIRLGERLRIEWHCDTAPGYALVPPLILQPLVENAVLHGVVPCQAGAQIIVEAYEEGGHLVMSVRNPVAEGAVHDGNQMALANIRERLELHFDVEARLRTYTDLGNFVVQIRLPIQREPSN